MDYEKALEARAANGEVCAVFAIGVEGHDVPEEPAVSRNGSPEAGELFHLEAAGSAAAIEVVGGVPEEEGPVATLPLLFRHHD